ncbi:MAG: hypothetical protein K0R29_1906 [Pseudobdellovibrio sp.]|jgi:hypothetical protein|nr:hypothetical protein [Pseudobdellovibrio sp.]
MVMNQKKLTILTLVVVAAGAVTVNELIMRAGNKEQNREVASFGERYVPEQIKWEQELAKTVSQNVGKTQIGAKPSISDKFLYEALEGRYNAEVVNGNILKISLRDSNDPVALDVQSAIKKYGAVFKNSTGFSTVKSADGTTEDITLQDNNGKQMGTVSVKRTAEGRVLNIEIK